MRLSIVTAAVCLCLVGLSSSDPCRASVGRTVNIPAEWLGPALESLAQDRGFQIVYVSEDVNGLKTQGATGKLTSEEALNTLLRGTGYTYRYLNENTVTLVSSVARTTSSSAGDDGPTTRAENRSARGRLRLAQIAQERKASSDVSLRQQPTSTALGPSLSPILVTARRQSETSLAVPVVLSVVTQEEIERRDLTSLDELTNVVPQLQIGQGTIQGGIVDLRGVGANANTTTADQGVTFDVDGAQVSRSSILRLAEMDMAQITVLEGPQALFFGKNSPGGVISIRTADPTPQFEAKTSMFYEFLGRNARFDGYASGPLTDTLGARVAILVSHESGWEENILPSSLPFASPRRSLPDDSEAATRLTLKFEPSDNFNARLKVNYGALRTAGNSETEQYTYCPFGVPQIPLGVNGSGDPCKAGNKVAFIDFGPNFQGIDPASGDEPKLNQSQWLSSLEMNYSPSRDLTLTSLSSMYKVNLRWIDAYFPTSDPQYVDVSDYNPDITEFGEELRLASKFAGPVNFLVGAYLQHSKFLYRTLDVGYPDNPTVFDGGFLDLDGLAVSEFGQLRVKPVKTIELAAGGRYSWEKKDASETDILAGGTPPSVPKNKWTNFSPEFTATWRPSNKLTIFAAHKEGFLSGGYTASGTPYDQEIAKGGEVGVKTLLFGNRLRANLSAYDYGYTGLQVTYVKGIQFATENAGKATVKGIEADATWQTKVEGLMFRGAVGYNHARYDIFTTTCYPGETIAAGCNVGPLVNGAFSLENLAGRPLNNAPDWSANASAIYDRDVSAGWRLGLSTDVSYSGGYFTDPTDPPPGFLKGYAIVDATLRLMSRDGHWEAVLLGRNLTNRHPYQISYSVLFTGGPSGTAGPSFYADRYAVGISQGVQVAIQISYRFGEQ